MLIKVIKRNEDLNCESLDKIQREPLKVVHLYEFVQVHRQHLKGDAQMLSKHKLVKSTYDVFLVFWIIIVQVLNQFGLHQTLLVQSLFVFQDLKSNKALFLVVVASEDNTKRPLAQLFVDFISVRQMFVHSDEVLLLVSVKAIICGLVEHPHVT